MKKEGKLIGRRKARKRTTNVT